ncbi:MAG: hypothetical protein RMJ36_00870 [Candidatus Calescibacterium sp.]|nr:hypothetical protein [Candidatus Calescibacterium sp.]MDW8132195.1 hypothetical protein [Candidatus Calescibacterium sp.]
MEPNKWTIKSYAKINWVLEILNIRKDGYHNISSIFDIIELFDIITIEFWDDEKWSVDIHSNVKELERENIIYRVFEELNSVDTRGKYRVNIKLEKNIPLGGGLGGGSSNAASIIYFLYYKRIIDIPSAFRMCKSLGSDVLPIFMTYLYKNHYIFCFERQNICVPHTKFYNSIYNFFLVFSPFRVNTKQAYEEYDKMIKNRDLFIGYRTYRFLSFLKKGMIREYFYYLIHNDFEKIIYDYYKNIYFIKEMIYDCCGKENVRVFLCGSGSTLAVITKDERCDVSTLKKVIEDAGLVFREVNVWF